MNARLHIVRYFSDCEIVHYANKDSIVTSYFNKVHIRHKGQVHTLDLPESQLNIWLGRYRLLRRLLRLDKCNVFSVAGTLDRLIVIRKGVVYHYEKTTQRLTQTLILKNCRNVLHQSLSVSDRGELFLGEYGANRRRASVPVYKSCDGGMSWRKVYEIPSKKTKHIHGCYWDPYGKQVWIFTGDEDSHAHVYVADRDFKHVRILGGGAQVWRACNAFFEPDRVYWIMDSPIQHSHLIRFDRATGRISKLTLFPGPGWSIKRTTDGYYMASTSCEKGEGVRDRFAHVFVSKNCEVWSEISKFKHDGLPVKYFKFGTVTFSDGPQTSQKFFIFGEAVKGLDGRAALCRLEFDDHVS